MSVTTSSANVEPPPLLFGQRSPSPHSFSSPPRSPSHFHHEPAPIASPHPQINDDIDMSTSTTLPPPEGQNHDREDANMEDTDTISNGHANTESNNMHTPTSLVAVEVAAVDEDAMDTTPDDVQAEVVANGNPDAPGAPASPAGSPPPSAAHQDASTNTDQTHIDEAVSENQAHRGTPPPIEPPPPADPDLQPPDTEQPPPPPVEASRTDSDSSDEDDSGQNWQPIVEDTSAPDEQEVKEIEEAGEVSALDHDHWEAKAYLPVDDPEYTVGESGRIEWLIDNYNGTKEKPNKELVMKSQVVTIGGHEWQIKFYPKGNDSDYLSIYVECLSVTDKEEKKADSMSEDAPKSEQTAEASDTMATDTSKDSKPASQHAPLPLLNSKSVPKRRSVAAQVSVVLYNPDEPRVNYSRTCLHRFCTGSPDWGWTRFHGPYYEIQHRLRGQRQALLRNDKLVFTGYVRVVDDETACLWEHHSRDNPWDSFAMTGLQSLSLGEGQSSPGGNFISAIACWMLFKPFRVFLYRFRAPEFANEPLIRPKPLIAALQKILYMLRTQVKPGSGPIGLEDVIDALDWYGIPQNLEKSDVVEVWETLRYKIEEELRDTPQAKVLDELFGIKKDYMSGTPSYRVPVKGISNMQEAIDKSSETLHPEQPLPQLLALELERQDFNVASRTWSKLTKKVALVDHIKVRGVGYSLYGFVVHNNDLQSGLYHPVLRPEGPNSKWYNYTDGKDENMVKCLTKRQVTAYEGSSSSDSQTGRDAVAYIALYVREDVASFAFSHDSESEQWDVPEDLVLLMEKQLTHSSTPPRPPIPADSSTTETKREPEEKTETKADTPPSKVHQFQVVDSKVFLQHEGSGTFDAYDSRWQPETSEDVHTVELVATDGCKEVQSKLASILPNVKDPRQVKFWFLDAQRGTVNRPTLISTGQIEFSSGSDHNIDSSDSWSLEKIEDDWCFYRIWVHVVDFDKLPELPKEEPATVPEPQTVPQSIAVSPTSQAPPPPPILDDVMPAEPAAENATEIILEIVPEPAAENPPAPEDTPMSEPDDEREPQTFSQPEEAQPPTTEANADRPDQAMDAELQDPDTISPNLGDENVIPNPSDTEMGGTQDLPPPPPPAELTNIPPPAPPAPVHVVPEEIYFFLKFFEPESQLLVSRGSHIALKSARIDTTVLSILDLPPDTAIELHEEDDLTTTHALRLRRSFSQNDLHNTCIIIATVPLTEDQRNSLAARAAFAEPQPYLAFRAEARNFPLRMNGHFTHSYFSSEYYKGEVKNGLQHGAGTRIYHNGATYTGSFQLSRRHGHGLYTYQNGDTYDGDFALDLHHGTGTFVEASTGNTYVGGWKHDKKFGEGVTHWKVAQETERLCRICWDEPAEAAFYDCGHVVACLGCARRVDSCPVCRKRVLSAMKLFYVA